MCSGWSVCVDCVFDGIKEVFPAFIEIGCGCVLYLWCLKIGGNVFLEIVLVRVPVAESFVVEYKYRVYVYGEGSGNVV